MSDARETVIAFSVFFIVMVYRVIERDGENDRGSECDRQLGLKLGHNSQPAPTAPGPRPAWPHGDARAHRYIFYIDVRFVKINV